ncbi:MAG: hypothetical protein Q9226_009450, partial [Calogaya cf. arnoldii]
TPTRNPSLYQQSRNDAARDTDHASYHILAFYADRLPHTLDFLVMEELVDIQTLVGSITVKRTLEAQIAPEKLSNGTFKGTRIDHPRRIFSAT